MSDSEVRYHYLRPKQIIEKRKEFPVAYIPIGTIEWHGVHMPTGADGIQAEGLAELCARKGGGLVFPTLYYGERRRFKVAAIAGKWGLTRNKFVLIWKKMLKRHSNWLVISSQSNASLILFMQSF